MRKYEMMHDVHPAIRAHHQRDVGQPVIHYSRNGLAKEILLQGVYG